MKLSEHVDKLRNLIEAAFDKHFARLGIGKARLLEADKLPAEVRGKRERYERVLENHIGETGDYEHAREKLIDELTFTLFNRLAAVKVMEAAALFPPILTKQPEHGDRSFGHKAWLEMNPHMRSEELEGIREYLKTAFDELGETLPLYGKAYPYALLPDAISINEIIDAFNTVEKDSQVGGDIWQSDDVLGWMYESYNNKKKQAHKESKAKTEYNKVSLQSQVYTPRWVVQFLVDNSLGKLYLEMYPDSEIKRRYKIANAPKAEPQMDTDGHGLKKEKIICENQCPSVVRKKKPLHEVKLIDPACGSGNFLLYAFDFFYELYIDQIENYGAEYEETDIPKLIIENNLHGIDLDDRAIQLAQLGLYIKARKKKRSIKTLNFKVVSSDFYLPEYEKVKHIFENGGIRSEEIEGNANIEAILSSNSPILDSNQRQLICEIWSDLQFAYKFGSLIQLHEKLRARLSTLISQREREGNVLFSDEDLGITPKPIQTDMFTEHDIEKEKIFIDVFIQNLKSAVERFAKSANNPFLASKTQDAITFLELLTSQYDVATANPPYTDSSDFGPDLKTFIDTNYKKPFKFHINLYATFIKRCYELTSENGKIAMIHPLSFMYIKTFEGVRKFILNNIKIDSLIELGLGGIFLTTKVDVDVTAYVFDKVNSQYSSSFFMNLQNYKGLKIKQKIFNKAFDDYLENKENKHNFEIDQKKFRVIDSWPLIYWISDDFRSKFTLPQISNFADIKSGLATANNDRFLRYWWEVAPNTISENHQIDKLKWVRYAKGGGFNKWAGNLWTVVNWGKNGEEMRSTGRSVFRNQEFYFQKGITYSATSSKGTSFRVLPHNCVYDVKGASAFIEGDADYHYILALFNSKMSSYIIDCLNNTVETQVGDIKRVPYANSNLKTISIIKTLVKENISLKNRLLSYRIQEPNYNKNPLLLNTSDSFRNCLKEYLCLENYLTTKIIINEAMIDDFIFISYELTHDDKKLILEKEGLSLVSFPVTAQAKQAYLAESYAICPLDNGKEYIEQLPEEVISIHQKELIENDFCQLYQKNSSLDAFCTRHQVNPINVWYWFKESNVIPKQRMNTLAMEFLADVLREILMEDEDGIIPLVPNAGEKLLLGRIEEKFQEKGFSMAKYSSFDALLGEGLNNYLNKYFFNHFSNGLNMFRNLPMTPFIWHISSGPEQGFDCYLIIYKWSRDKLMRLRSVYIEHRERSLVNRQSDLASNDSAEAQNEKDRIFRQLQEIEDFKKKIDELLAEGYDPILDDGVGKNIAPLQKKKMIPYEVLNAGQLKKYLNADW